MTPESAGSGLPRWLLELLSVDTERLQGGTEHLRFARFPEGGLGLLAILAVLAGFAFIAWNYRREGQLTRWKKSILAALRCTLLAVLVLALFYPILELDRAEEVRASTVLLVDESLSQTIKDRYAADTPRRDALARALGMKPEDVPAATRRELVRKAIFAPEMKVIERLGGRNNLKGYTFASSVLEPMNLQVPSPADATSAGEGTQKTITDLSGALRSAVEAEAGGRIAAVVLLTDGRVTAGEDLKSAGVFLAGKDIPVHAVGVGDPAPSRNFRVTAVLSTERVFTGDPVVVDVRLDEHGFDGETVRIDLTDVFEPAGEAPRAPVKVETQEVAFPADRSDATASFRFEPQGVGRHRLTAAIEPRSDETFSEDNERGIVVEVVKEASKALLISGGPTYEYRFLKNLLRRDSRVSLAGWLMSADPDYPQEGDVSLKKLPATARDLFEYDVVILMDLDPQGLPPGFPLLLEEFVGKHRGGLLFAAGEKFGASLFDAPDAAPIRNMLPVVVDAGEVRDETGRGKFYEKEWPLVPAPAALSHAATRLSSQIDRNRDLWAEIAGVYWSFPARKLKPGATALFVHPDPAIARDGEPRPLVAVQFYAGGRVMWCGIDSTWRWRATAEEVYDRFWVQTVRYLTESRLLGDRRRLIQTDKDAYDLGDTIRISAFVTDESFRPIEADEQVIFLEAPQNPPVELRLSKDASAPGWYRGIFVPRATGEHKLRIAAKPGEAGSEKAVRVDAPAVELEEPRLDEEALRELAALTGGSYSTLAEIAVVPDRIPDRSQVLVTTDEPIPLWDNGLSMSLLAALLAIEWILRKVNRLL